MAPTPKKKPTKKSTMTSSPTTTPAGSNKSSTRKRKKSHDASESTPTSSSSSNHGITSMISPKTLLKTQNPTPPSNNKKTKKNNAKRITPDESKSKTKSSASTSSTSSTSTSTTSTTRSNSTTKPSNTSSTTTSTSSPQISVQVHRFRNANYIPRSILKLCATPLPSMGSPSSSSSFAQNNNSIVPHLAISREGGSVELVSIDEKWKCVGIVEGLKKRNVDAMAWLCPSSSSSSAVVVHQDTTSVSYMDEEEEEEDDDPAVLISDESESNSSTVLPSSSTSNQYFCPNHQHQENIQSHRRLFGASRDGTIFEIDFQTKTHIGVIGSGGGAVFCLEALSIPLSSSSSSQRLSKSLKKNNNNDTIGYESNLLAAGCEDGSIRIFKAVANRDKQKMNASGNIPCLELISTLPSVGCAVTSIAWVPPPPPLPIKSTTTTTTTTASTSSLEGSVLYAGVADGTIRKFTLVSTLQNSRATGSVPHAISTGLMLTNSNNNIGETSTTSSSPLSSSSSSSSSFAGLQWKATARLTVENQGTRISTKIWSIKALHDGTIVSGDSMGNIQFWDGTSGTLLQSIPHNKNDADVNDLAVNLDQTKIMASGIDSRVICLEYDASSKTSKKWILSHQQRSHTHDVTSLAMVYMTDPTGSLCGNQTNLKKTAVRELLCSGGVDTKVCSYLVSNMRKYRPKIAYKYPSNAPVVLSKKPRIMSIMRSDRVDIYQLRQKVPDAEIASGGSMAFDEEKAHLGSVRISSNHNLISFDVNDDGTLLAASHAAGIYLFRLEYIERFEDGEEEEDISRKIVKPTRINVPIELNSSCSSIRFSKKDTDLLVCAHCNNTINMLKVQQESDDDQSLKVVLKHSFKDEGSNRRNCHRYPITHLDISPDGRWFAVGRNSIGKGCLNVYSLAPSCRHWWTIPCTEAPFACMKFLGNGSVDPALAVSLNSSVFYLFDVERRCLSDWSQDLGFPASPNLPKELSQSKDCPDRLAFNPCTPSKFLMGGPAWFCSIDLDAPIPRKSKPYPPDHFKAKHWERVTKKRPRSNSTTDDSATNNTQIERSESDSRNFTICLRYSGMIFLDFLDDNELVVVEQPWLGIVNSLPNALERQRYGS